MSISTVFVDLILALSLLIWYWHSLCWSDIDQPTLFLLIWYWHCLCWSDGSLHFLCWSDIGIVFVDLMAVHTVFVDLMAVHTVFVDLLAVHTVFVDPMLALSLLIWWCWHCPFVVILALSLFWNQYSLCWTEVGIVFVLLVLVFSLLTVPLFFWYWCSLCWPSLCCSDIGTAFVDIGTSLCIFTFHSLFWDWHSLCWSEVGTVFVVIWHCMQASPEWFWCVTMAAISPQDSFPLIVQGKTTGLSTKLNSQKNKTGLRQKSYPLFQEQSCNGQIIIDFFFHGLVVLAVDCAVYMQNCEPAFYFSFGDLRSDQVWNNYKCVIRPEAILCSWRDVKLIQELTN